MMLNPYPLTTLALVVALFVYFGLSTVVGMARAKWNVPAPASSGHPEFDKRYRVQMNTVEQLLLFVPAVLVAAPVLGDAITAGFAALWSVGRIVYARSYYADPTKRGPGFGLTLLPSMVMLLAGAWGAVMALI
ncbi:MAG: MAPEG family protein [Sandarakinorhabdus sp.]|jgi:glutathione S-transferase